MAEVPAPQVVVVVQQAPVAAEPVQKCCMCIDIPCGITILMILEIIYTVFLVITLMGIFALGALAMAADGGSGKRCS